MPLKPLDRRTFLRSSGVAIGLPFLDAMLPRGVAAEKTAEAPIKRMLLIGRPLGMHAPYFFPEKSGKDYKPSRYLKILEPFREQFTVFSGISHRYATGHFAEVGLMTGVRPDLIRPTEVRNGISLDQEVASHFGGQTRFASLVVGGGNVSWNRRGVRIPSEQHYIRIFKQLFVRGTPEEEAREMSRIQDGQSILDDVRDQVSSINKTLSDVDRQRLDLYLSSVRDAETRLQQDEKWSKTPKPKVNYPLPTTEYSTTQLSKFCKQWYDLVHLALQTDSTRSISLWLGSQVKTGVEGVTIAHHDASHHGQEATKVEQLALIEEAELHALADFFEKMKQSSEGGQTLLDRTQILFSSNLGNASSHDNTNLPILLAGGGYKHQGHVGYDRKNNTLLSNLFVRMLHQMGIEAKSFGASTGVVSEI